MKKRFIRADSTGAGRRFRTGIPRADCAVHRRIRPKKRLCSLLLNRGRNDTVWRLQTRRNGAIISRSTNRTTKEGFTIKNQLIRAERAQGIRRIDKRQGA
ncbi:MAG: hypothetical protein Q4C72_05640 [Eubacteriales bacterium]|nr:hypothetical protein [Eubacteriales bacterium]